MADKDSRSALVVIPYSLYVCMLMGTVHQPQPPPKYALNLKQISCCKQTKYDRAICLKPAARSAPLVSMDDPTTHIKYVFVFKVLPTDKVIWRLGHRLFASGIKLRTPGYPLVIHL